MRIWPFLQRQITMNAGAFMADVCNATTEECESPEEAQASIDWLKQRLPRTDDRNEWRQFLLAVARKAVEILEGGHR